MVVAKGLEMGNGKELFNDMKLQIHKMNKLYSLSYNVVPVVNNTVLCT